MTTERTLSEHLFEEFCTTHGITFEQIPRAGTKTADYRLALGEHTVVAEVKQLDPGPGDGEIARQLAARGRAAMVLVPGVRVRQEIHDSRKQLRAQAKGRHPALLVLYNNTGVGTGMIAPHDVLVAMYGEERVEFVVERGPAGANRQDRFVAGRNSGVTQTDNRTLSAIGVLGGYSGNLRLDVYHNCYASLPFDPNWLRCSSVCHFAVTPFREGAFRDWRPA